MIFEEIYPNVIVYKNVYEDIDLFYERLNFVYENTDGNYKFDRPIEWSIFGDYMMQRGPDDHQESLSVCQEYESYIVSEMAKATATVLESYIDYTGMVLPENYFLKNDTPSRYGIGEDFSSYCNNGLRMEFHSDYKINEHGMPLENLLVSCNHYINDDYEGGEIIFLLDENIIPYKPEAGDIIVFPSGSPDYYPGEYPLPYFHAANDVTGKPKHFIRTTLVYDQQGSDQWHSIKENFKGEEDWKSYMKEIGFSASAKCTVFLGLTNSVHPLRNFNLDQYTAGDEFHVQCSEAYMKYYNLSEFKKYSNN